jgi:hypothetical protein
MSVQAEKESKSQVTDASHQCCVHLWISSVWRDEAGDGGVDSGLILGICVSSALAIGRLVPQREDRIGQTGVQPENSRTDGAGTKPRLALITHWLTVLRDGNPTREQGTGRHRTCDKSLAHALNITHILFGRTRRLGGSVAVFRSHARS